MDEAAEVDGASVVAGGEAAEVFELAEAAFDACRRAAERFGVSAASAIRWRQLALQHGTPTAKPQGGDRRTVKIEEHASFILDAIKQQPDPTLAELREMLAARGVNVSIATL